MKITVECKCGNKVEITPETMGNVAYFANDLRNENFYLNDICIDKQLFSETVTEVNRNISTFDGNAFLHVRNTSPTQ